MNNTILDFSSIYDLFILLFTQYPKSLKEITVISNIEINIDELTNLINVNNYNTLEKIILEFNKSNSLDIILQYTTMDVDKDDYILINNIIDFLDESNSLDEKIVDEIYNPSEIELEI